MQTLRLETGSFTIEASLLFPFILLMMIALLFLSIYMYQKVSLYYMASHVAEKTAFHWTNSYKEPIEGEVEMGKADELYWRFTDDRMLGGLLQMNDRNKPETYTIGNAKVETLPEKKMKKVADLLPDGISGNVTYRNKLSSREIEVKLQSSLKVPSFLNHILGNSLMVTTTSKIVDPVEFIRNVELIRDYSNKLEKSKNKARLILQKAISNDRK
jgi:hypothetical protein